MERGRDIWTRRHARVVDQREYRIPPAWRARPARRDPQSELGRTVHVSGRNRELANRVVSMLAGARDKAVLSSFLLADREIEDAVLAAARRKVRVYVLLASEARLDTEGADGEFERAMRDQHRDMLGRLGGHALFHSAPHFHAKFVLTDPGTGAYAGLLLTANLTREALERNEELGVALTHDEVEDVFGLARWAFWEHAEHELIDPEDRFRSVKPLGFVEHPRPSPSILATTSEVRQLRDKAAALIESASEELVVSSFGWDKDHEIVEFLCVRAREGLPVTALARIRENQMPALLALAEAGAYVLGFKWLHAKALCADDKALVMSANLQPDGLDRGFELGVSLEGDRAGEVRARLREWSGAARWELSPSPKLGDLEGEALVWRGNRLVETMVERERRIDLGSVTAASADRLDDTAPPKLPDAGEMPEPAHEIVYEWSVQAPVLAVNAKPVLQVSREKNDEPIPYDPPVFLHRLDLPRQVNDKPIANEPPVFDEPGGRRVVAVDFPQQIPKAREVAANVKAAAIVVRR